MLQQPVAQICFDFLDSLPIVVKSKHVQVSSDAGILLFRQFDDQIRLTERFAAHLEDRRDACLTDHEFVGMVRQRVLGILADYEDCNDHDALRSDPIFKLVAGRRLDENDLASQPTLSRFENSIEPKDLWRLHDFFIDDFIGSFPEPPRRITLDLDATPDSCHGQQQLALFNGFYDEYVYHPLIITCAETKQVVWAALRFGTASAACGADVDVEYIMSRLRQAWPEVQIEVRADAGFGVPKMYGPCERLGLMYTFGLTPNAVLKREAEGVLERAVAEFARTREPVRLFHTFMYQAKGWPHERQVVAKAECNSVGTNLRFVVTNRPGASVVPEACYDEYVARGESENRHKELKNGLSGDRLSCHRFMANYFRLQLHTLALNLLIRFRRSVADRGPLPLTNLNDRGGEAVPVSDPSVPAEALTGEDRRRYQRYACVRDPLGHGQIETWRTMVIKVAAEVVQSARRVVVTLPASWPYLPWFEWLCRRLGELRGSTQAVT